MKVLQLTVHFAPNVGGVETHLTDLVTALVKRKIQTVVLAYRPLAVKAPWKMLEKSSFLTIIRLPWFPGLFYRLVHNPAAEFLYLTPGLFLATPFVLLSEKPDVIQAHGIVAGFVGVFWGKVFKKRIVVTTHNIYHFPKKGAYTSFVHWIFSNADAVLCLSNQSKDEVALLGIPEKKVHVFTYWIDQQLFRKMPYAKKQLGLSNNFSVLFVGRLVTEKGIKVLLEAAKNWHKDITLLLAGIGTLESLVKEKADGEHIVYVGKTSQKDLPLYYSAADVLIVPSVHEEGFGRVLLESLACGTPVIAAKRGGITEAIDDSVGYLIDINQANIKKMVEYCYKYKIELKKKSENGELFVKKKFSDKNVEKIINTYASK